MNENILELIKENLIKGQANNVKNLVQQAIQQGIPPKDILNLGLLAGMNVIGERFKKNEIYVPEVLIAARAMKFGMEVLQPVLAISGIEPRGIVILGTIKGDLHDIGKNLVKMMLEGAGFKVIDLGIDVPAEKFIDSAIAHNAKLVGVSALLTTTMVNMKDVVNERNKRNLKDKIKIIIGGAPVTQAFCDEIGADGYAPDAASGADLAKQLIN